MKVGDFVIIVYYIPDTSEYGPVFDCYYGKITKFTKDTFINYQVWGSIENGKLKLGKNGDYRIADTDMVHQGNSKFGLKYLDEYFDFAKNSYDKIKNKQK